MDPENRKNMIERELLFSGYNRRARRLSPPRAPLQFPLAYGLGVYSIVHCDLFFSLLSRFHAAMGKRF